MLGDVGHALGEVLELDIAIGGCLSGGLHTTQVHKTIQAAVVDECRWRGSLQPAKRHDAGVRGPQIRKCCSRASSSKDVKVGEHAKNQHQNADGDLLTPGLHVSAESRAGQHQRRGLLRGTSMGIIRNRESHKRA